MKPRVSRQRSSRRQSDGPTSELVIAEVDDATETTMTTRRRLHYVDFGRVEEFLRGRLQEAQNKRQDDSFSANQSLLSPSAENSQRRIAISSPLVTTPGVAARTATTRSSAAASATSTSRRGWIRRANRARRQLAQRLVRIVGGCLGTLDNEDVVVISAKRAEDSDQSGETDAGGIRLHVKASASAASASAAATRELRSTRDQRCNNATQGITPASRDDVIQCSSTLGSASVSTLAYSARGPTTRARQSKQSSGPLTALSSSSIIAQAAPDFAFENRTSSLHPRNRSSSCSKSVATTLTAMSAALEPVTMPSSAVPSLKQRNSAQNKCGSSKLSRVETVQSSECNQRLGRVSRGTNEGATATTGVRVKSGRRIGEGGHSSRVSSVREDVKSAGSRVASRTRTGVSSKRSSCDKTTLLKAEASTNNQSTETAETAESADIDFDAALTNQFVKNHKNPNNSSGWKKRPDAKAFSVTTRLHPTTETKNFNGEWPVTPSTSAATRGKLATVTSEGLAWSADMASLKQLNVKRPGDAKQQRIKPLPCDPLNDAPKSVALRRYIECPLIPLMTYKTDKKAELFYTVVQLCNVCRKDVCPKCRRSLCNFCTIITCPECRILLRQMIEITRLEGGRGPRRLQAANEADNRQLVRAGVPSEFAQARPHCHSCEKPICMSCTESLSMNLPSNEHCHQHNKSGNAYENICPWCGRTICRECRRSSCCSCSRAFACSCKNNCQCDSRSMPLP